MPHSFRVAVWFPTKEQLTFPGSLDYFSSHQQETFSATRNKNTTHKQQILCYDRLNKGSYDMCVVIWKASIILI